MNITKIANVDLPNTDMFLEIINLGEDMQLNIKDKEVTYANLCFTRDEYVKLYRLISDMA